jgi:hypothetical protein
MYFMGRCIVGSLDIDYPHIYDGNKFTYENELTQNMRVYSKGETKKKEEIPLVMPNYQAQQLVGLCDLQEVVWVDTSIQLNDNEDITHKGWYLLSVKDFEEIGITHAKVILDAKPVSKQAQTYMEMDYSSINELYIGYGYDTTLSEAYYQTTKSGTTISVDTNTQFKSCTPQGVGQWDNAWSEWCDPCVGWSNHIGIMGGGVASAYNWGGHYRDSQRLLGYMNFNLPATGVQVVGWKFGFAAGRNSGWYESDTWYGWELSMPNGASTSMWDQGYASGWHEYWYESPFLTTVANNPSLLNNWGLLFFCGVHMGQTCEVDWFASSLWYIYTAGTYTRIQPIDITKSGWNQLTCTTTEHGGTVKWDIYRASDNLLLRADQTGDTISLSGLPHVDLKFVAKFTVVGGTSPTIADVAVSESS